MGMAALPTWSARAFESRALMLRANTMGANSMTRANLTMVPMSPARWPFWKDAAITCAISWIEAPLHNPYA
jgi:hypothetical protein